MEICWDNLEKLQFTKNGYWKKSTQTYYEKICMNCKKDYLGTKNSKYCSKTCATSSRENNPFNAPIRQNAKHSEETKKKMSISKKELYKNKDFHFFKGRGFAWFDTYASKIEFAEEVRRAIDNPNILEVKCKYCGKWFKPLDRFISLRIRALNGDISSEHNLYCSEECKHACPIYYKHKYPVGFTGDENSSREVQPELRKLVFERDNYTCQKCYLNSNNSCVELHCHHIDPVKLNPIESADIDNCITLCKDCHLEVHQKDGCKTGQLANC